MKPKLFIFKEELNKSKRKLRICTKEATKTTKTNYKKEKRN